MLNQQNTQKFESVSHLKKYSSHMVRLKIIIINYAENNANDVLFHAQHIYFSVFWSHDVH
jgi:hypothetical protein